MQVGYSYGKQVRDKGRIARVLMIVTLMLPLTVATVKAENFGYTHTAIIIGVYPPWQAYAGDNVTVRVRVQALENLRDIDLYIYAHGSRNEGYDSWTKYLSIMNDTNLPRGSVHEGNYSLAIPSDASAGLVYAVIHIHYGYWSDGWHECATDIVFQITYLKNRSYEDLQSDYINLLNEYNSYRQDHSYTDSGYSGLSAISNALGSLSSYLQILISGAWGVDLGLNRDLAHLLVGTTVILSISASSMALKRYRARGKAYETSRQVPRTSMHRTASQVLRLFRKGYVGTKTPSFTEREGEEDKNLIKKAQEILSYR